MQPSQKYLALQDCSYRAVWFRSAIYSHIIIYIYISWWNQLKNIPSTFDLAPGGTLLSKSECILKLQEDFIHEWEKQLWSDTRKMGGN